MAATGRDSEDASAPPARGAFASVCPKRKMERKRRTEEEVDGESNDGTGKWPIRYFVGGDDRIPRPAGRSAARLWSFVSIIQPP